MNLLSFTANFGIVFTKSNLGRSDGGFLIDKSFLLQQALDMYANDLHFWPRLDKKYTKNYAKRANACIRYFVAAECCRFFLTSITVCLRARGQTDCKYVV